MSEVPEDKDIIIAAMRSGELSREEGQRKIKESQERMTDNELETMPQAAAVIARREDGQLFICERSKTTAYQGFYQCPGGSVEEGEPPKTAAIRELLEETNLNIHPNRVKLLGSIETMHVDGYMYRLWVFDVTLRDHEVPEQTEPEKHGPWFPIPLLGLLEKHQDRKMVMVPAWAQFMDLRNWELPPPTPNLRKSKFLRALALLEMGHVLTLTSGHMLVLDDNKTLNFKMHHAAGNPVLIACDWPFMAVRRELEKIDAKDLWPDDQTTS